MSGLWHHRGDKGPIPGAGEEGGEGEATAVVEGEGEGFKPIRALSEWVHFDTALFSATAGVILGGTDSIHYYHIWTYNPRFYSLLHGWCHTRWHGLDSLLPYMDV